MLLIPLAFLAFVSLGLPDGVLGIAWPSVRDAYRLREAEFALLLIGAGPGYFLSGLLAARTLGYLGLAGTLVASTTLVAAGLGLFAAALPWPLPIAALALVGLGSGTIDAGVNAFASARFSARQVNWLHASYSVGAAIGPAVMTAALAGGFGWRGGYAALAGAMIAMAIVFAATRLAWREPGAAATGGGAPTGTIREALRHPLVRIQTALFFVYTGLEAMLGAWSFTVLQDGRGMATEAAGLAVSAYFAAIVVGRIGLGAAVDRIGPDRLVRWGTVGALAGALLFAAGPPILAVAGLVVAGLSLAPIFPTLISRTSSRLPEAIVLHAVGLKVSAAMIGAASLPILTALAVDRFGLGLAGPIAVAAACTLIGLNEALVAWTRRLSAA